MAAPQEMSDESVAAAGPSGSSRRTVAWAYAAVATTISMWGYSAVAIKMLSSDGLVVAFYRLWFAIPLLWLSALVVPSMRRRLGRKWFFGCLVGGAFFGLHQILFFIAIKMTSVANVTIIGALQPVLVLLVAGPMFGEYLRRAAAGWAVVALAGTGLVVVGSAGAPEVSPMGDLLAFGNLFAFTGYFLVSRRVRAHVGPWEYVVGMTTVSGLVITTTVAVVQPDLGSPAGWDWLVLLTLAVFPGTIGHVLTNWAHAHVAAFSISMMFLAAPIVSSASALAFLGETVNGMQIVGGLIVLVAIGATVAQAGESTGGELAESAAETDAP